MIIDSIQQFITQLKKTVLEDITEEGIKLYVCLHAIANAFEQISNESSTNESSKQLDTNDLVLINLLEYLYTICLQLNTFLSGVNTRASFGIHLLQFTSIWSASSNNKKNYGKELLTLLANNNFTIPIVKPPNLPHLTNREILFKLVDNI